MSQLFMARAHGEREHHLRAVLMLATRGNHPYTNGTVIV